MEKKKVGGGASKRDATQGRAKGDEEASRAKNKRKHVSDPDTDDDESSADTYEKSAASWFGIKTARKKNIGATKTVAAGKPARLAIKNAPEGTTQIASTKPKSSVDPKGKAEIALTNTNRLLKKLTQCRGRLQKSKLTRQMGEVLKTTASVGEMMRNKLTGFAVKTKPNIAELKPILVRYKQFEKKSKSIMATAKPHFVKCSTAAGVKKTGTTKQTVKAEVDEDEVDMNDI